jgi:4-hydroxy-4-methyl-2-oxoglutarate aldolase
MGLPIWARWVRVRGATKTHHGWLGVPVTVGGAEINEGDIVVMDADGACVVTAARADQVLGAARARAEKERVKREQLRGGALSYDLDGLRP